MPLCRVSAVKSRRIVRSIMITTVLLLALQGMVFTVVCAVMGVPVRGHLWFPPALLAFHAVLGVVLCALRDLFRRAEDQHPLERVNVANILSMIRVSSTPTILWLILIADEFAVVPFLATMTALVFLTDLLDGQISRRTHQVTEIGKYLDSASDYAILFVTSIALRVYQLIAVWLFILILARLVFQGLAQSIILVVQRWKIAPRSSLLGKAAVFTVMVFYAAALLRLLPSLPVWFGTAFTIVQAGTGVVVAASLGEKIYFFMLDLRTARGVARQ